MDITRDEDVRRAYARDASGIELVPEGVARATTVSEIVDIVNDSRSNNESVTPAGAQTSMTAGSITDRGVLLSLGKMNRIIDIDRRSMKVRVEPGCTIGELNAALRPRLMFAPDPTSENDATVGGAIACNASGARSLYYGATRRHVTSLKIVHADGSVMDYRRSRAEKNTVGYAAAQDPVDWFVGSEGTLGIVAEAELALVERPVHLIGLAVPFRSETAALDFVVRVRDGRTRTARCLEFFDAASAGIAAEKTGRKWSDSVAAFIYLEDDVDEDAVESALEPWLALAEGFDAIVDDIRVYDGAAPLREAREMRHAVPATMNERGSAFISAGGRKVSTDWAVPPNLLHDALVASREAVERHGAAMPITYGHAGNGHPHQNFIAEDAESLRRIYAAVEETLHKVIAMGGTVSAEHGLGKLKRDWLHLQFSPRQIELMRAMKNMLDPKGILSPGNIL